VIYQLSLMVYQTFPRPSCHHPRQPGFRPGSELAKLMRSPGSIHIEIRRPNQRPPTTRIRIFLSLSTAQYDSKNEIPARRQAYGFVSDRQERPEPRLLSRDGRINITHNERTLSENVAEAFRRLGAQGWSAAIRTPASSPPYLARQELWISFRSRGRSSGFSPGSFPRQYP
jgi:hypothetical protein